MGKIANLVTLHLTGILRARDQITEMETAAKLVCAMPEVKAYLKDPVLLEVALASAHNELGLRIERGIRAIEALGQEEANV